MFLKGNFIFNYVTTEAMLEVSLNTILCCNFHQREKWYHNLTCNKSVNSEEEHIFRENILFSIWENKRAQKKILKTIQSKTLTAYITEQVCFPVKLSVISK